MDFRFTREYFLQQIVEFRQLMGDKTFWRKTEEQREQAIKALSFVYFNADLKPEDSSTFDITLQEYSRRSIYLLRFLV